MTITLDDGFDQPRPVTDVLVAFPASVAHLMPVETDIPLEFRRDHGAGRPWRKLQAQWFFRGIGTDVVVPKEGIDADAAWRHLKCIQGSFEPKHQHKQAAVAWLMSRWFDLNKEATA